MKRQAGTLDLFLGDVVNSLASRLKPYINKIQERFETMEKAEKARTAPQRYFRLIQKLKPENKDDWRAGDVCFLKQYKNNPDLHQYLLELRDYYFNNRKS